MFNFDSTILNSANVSGQSISSIKENQIENCFLFSNTKMPLSSIQYSSSSFLEDFIPDSDHQFEKLHEDNNNTGTTSHFVFDIKTNPLKYESIIKPNPFNKSELHISNDCKETNDIHLNEKKTFLIPSTCKTATSTPFLFDKNSTSPTTLTFSFGNDQISNFSSDVTILGDSLLDNRVKTVSSVPFNYSLTKSTKTVSSTTIPTLFSMSTGESKPTNAMFSKNLLNNGLGSLAQTNKSNINTEKTRFRTSLMTRSQTNLFSPALNKSTMLLSTSINLTNSLPNHSNEYLTKHPLTSNSNKRKLDDSFVDDIIDNNSTTASSIPKINIKRPRMLDMNKIRSIVLGNNTSINETMHNQSLTSESFIDGWKIISSQDEYVTTKKDDRRTFQLPKLTQKDYYMKPTIEELSSYFNEQGQCFVKEFTVGRKHYGSVTFQGSRMNLAGLDLDRLVEIDRRQVTVYPNESDRPVEGQELNCQAIISLFGVYPIDRTISNSGEEVTDPNRLNQMNYGKYLEGMTKKFHGQFINYDVQTGTWTFRVEHF